MKFKRIALLSATAAVAAVSLASCNGGSSNKRVKDTKNLDISINYNGAQGVSMREDSYTNPVDGLNYTKGKILPLWSRLGELTGYGIKDACSYSTGTINTDFDNIQTDKYASQTSSKRTIDLLYANTSKINPAGAAGQAVNLLDHLDEMPNFKAFLNDAENQGIKETITYDGGIYYTPYYDGMNYIEKMISVNHAWVQTLLDANDTTDFDQTTNGTGAAKNVLQEAKYQPFMDDNYNYPDAETEVVVSTSKETNKTKKIVIKQTTNIIKQQNELLATGATGAQLAQQLIDYLNAAFDGQVGAGKTYEKLSDIFLSEQAAYNADELIALMRVVKANPGKLTGDATSEIEVFCPRGATNNRCDNIQDFMGIWGVQGTTGEKDMLYFDADGKLRDAGSTQATYDALDYLQQIYDEGLIINDFSNTSDTVSGGTYYLNRYFSHTDKNPGNGFMVYDYNASTSACNLRDSAGIGTLASKLTNNQTSTRYFAPIITPLSYWTTKTSDNDYAKGIKDNRANQTLMRYTEDNRGLKSTSWMIPSNSDNITGALAMMDIMFSEKGAWLNNFGPESYWEEANPTTTYAGKKTPKLSANALKIDANSANDFWSDMRGYVGATHGIGNVRPASLNYQVTNADGKQGIENMDNAISTGAVTLSLMSRTDNLKFAVSVPSSGYTEPGKEIAATYDAVAGFWSTTLVSTDDLGWCKYVQLHDASNEAARNADGSAKDEAIFGKGASAKNDYSYKNVMDQRYTTRLTGYLYQMATSLGTTFNKQYVPSYIPTTTK